MIAEQIEHAWEPHLYRWSADNLRQIRQLELLPRHVEARDGFLLERDAAGTLQPLRWSSEEYHRLAEAGLFQGVRVELIEGLIIAMSPMKSPHWASVVLVQQVLQQTFQGNYVITAQLPVRLHNGTEPEPDVAVITGTARDYARALPATAVLVVEVSETTLAYDRSVKTRIYAVAGIPEYWIVDLNARRVEVYRQREPGFASPYADPILYGEADEIAPLTHPEARIRVADLLP